MTKAEMRAIYYEVRCPIEPKLPRQTGPYRGITRHHVSCQPFSSEPSGNRISPVNLAKPLMKQGSKHCFTYHPTVLLCLGPVN